MRPMTRYFIIIVLLSCLFIWFVIEKQQTVLSTKWQLPIEESKHVEMKRNHGLIVLYNRVPKTGSTSFMNIMYKLTSSNHFMAAYVNVSYKGHIWLFKDQYFFANNITNWKTPALYHGHFPFLNFISMGFKQPLYINIVRDPLERLVSHYYFLRYGDTYLPNKIRKKQGDLTTFDECVQKGKADCSVDKLWLQIPYFCGSDSECWKPGNRGALHRAKRNVINYYFLVGITENLGQFIEVLDDSLQGIFTGASNLFNENGGFHIRKTKKKIPLESATIDFFQTQIIWKLEQEFYLFIKERFRDIYKGFKKERKIDFIKVVSG